MTTETAESVFDRMRDQIRGDDVAAPKKDDDGTDEEKPKRRIAAADFTLTKIGDELPEEPPPAPRATRVALMENLEAITEDPNVWYVVASYKSPNGAAKVVKAITEEKQKVPEGHVFDVEARRVENPAGHGRQHSAVCAMCVAE